MNIVKLNREPIYRKPRVGDIKHSYADISKAENLIDFKPKVNLNEGLKELIESI